MLQSYFAIWFYHIFFVLSNVLHHFNAFLVFHCLSGMTHTQLPIADTVLRGLSPATIINKAAGNTSAIVLFGCSVMSNSLRPQLQHARLPCPSLSPRVCLNSRALSQWCHPTISSPVVPFSSRLQSFLASESFPMSQLFASGGQRTAASASVLLMNIQNWFPLRLTGLILQSKDQKNKWN